MDIAISSLFGTSEGALLISGAEVEERGVAPTTIPTPSKTISLDVLVGGGARVGIGERLRGGRMGVAGVVDPFPCTNLVRVGVEVRGERGSKMGEGGLVWLPSDAGDVGAG
jgi:hypothetical protein